MRKLLLFLSIVLVFGSCVKPQYKTREGKKKLKYYNSIQYKNAGPKEKYKQK